MFYNFYFLLALSFMKSVPISNISIIEKGAHSNVSMGAIWHGFAIASIGILKEKKWFINHQRINITSTPSTQNTTYVS